MMQQLSGEGHTERQAPAIQPQEEVHMSGNSINPLYILGGITLGIPIIALILLVAANPGVQEGTLSTLAMFLVLSAFAVAAMFETKRLADQPSGSDNP